MCCDFVFMVLLGVFEYVEVFCCDEVLYVLMIWYEQLFEWLVVLFFVFWVCGEFVFMDCGIVFCFDGVLMVFLFVDWFVVVDWVIVMIDCVVEFGGFVCIVWNIDEGMFVDSYLWFVIGDFVFFIFDLWWFVFVVFDIGVML